MTYVATAKRLSHIAHEESTGPADVDYMLRTRTVRVKTPVDAAAATETEHVLFTTEKACHILLARVVPQGATAADDTDYATLALKVGDLAAGALGAAIATKTTQVTGGAALAANTKLDVYSGSSAVAADKRVSLAVTKTGDGKVVPVLLVEVTYTID